MGEYNKKKVVILNYKAEIIGCFDSLKDFADYGGFPPSSVSHAFRAKRVYRCMKIILETEYHERYMKGTIEELKFKTLKERNIEKGARLRIMTKEAFLERNRKISEYHKKLVREGKDAPVFKAIERVKKPIICVENSTYYPCVKDASRALNINDSYICSVLKGKRKSAHGLTFKYV